MFDAVLCFVLILFRFLAFRLALDIATSPPNSNPQPIGPTSADSSFSGMDFEIECVDIHVDGNGILGGLIPPAKKEE